MGTHRYAWVALAAALAAMPGGAAEDVTKETAAYRGTPCAERARVPAVAARPRTVHDHLVRDGHDLGTG